MSEKPTCAMCARYYTFHDDSQQPGAPPQRRCRGDTGFSSTEPWKRRWNPETDPAPACWEPRPEPEEWQRTVRLEDHHLVMLYRHAIDASTEGDGIEDLRRLIEAFTPLTAEEAEKALAEADPIPLSPGEIDDIVKKVTGRNPPEPADLAGWQPKLTSEDVAGTLPTGTIAAKGKRCQTR